MIAYISLNSKIYDILHFAFDEIDSCIVLPAAILAACWHAQAVSSEGRSLTSSWEQVSDSNFHIAAPIHHVKCSSKLIVVLVWRWSFASAYHVANSNKSSWMILLCAGSSRFSKTGMEH